MQLRCAVRGVGHVCREALLVGIGYCAVEVAAGKLACLFMASPRMVADYANRYGATPSIIASQMAGQVVTKLPSLAYLYWLTQSERWTG